MTATTHCDVVILGGARDFHAMDWYRTVREVCPETSFVFLTDLFGGEGYPNLVREEDVVVPLFIIDRLLCSRTSRFANVWRNLLKLAISPLQAWKLRRFVKKSGCRIVHAHPMYYMLLCWMAGVPYVGTPQGDELLIRPDRSTLYAAFASRLLRGARAIAIDSVQMKTAARRIGGVEALIVQNGIDVAEINKFAAEGHSRFRITSNRGIESLYRIKEIVEARNRTLPAQPLTLTYPFFDSDYLETVRGQLREDDENLGRVAKEEMYRRLQESVLVISIPRSDSSPRSVYEAIFSGCSVAVVYNPWIEALPDCMRERIIVVELESPSWLADAYQQSLQLAKCPFVPCEQALELYDEKRSLRRAATLLY